jgi:glycosyltransferase involved in cell wall biosynthesis
MKLSVVIPCYNERATIGKVVDAVRNCGYPDLELIVVDDYSTDGTRDLLQAGPLKARIDRLILHPRNRGKGAALRTGFAAVTGSMVVIQDADLEYDPADFPRLVDPIVRGVADVVYGSRFTGVGERRVARYWHRAINWALTVFSNMCSNLALTDMETCYKAMRVDIMRGIEIEENRFGIEPEVTAKLAKLDCRIYEVAISYDWRSREHGKKIGWKDGFSALRCIVKYNFFR